VFDRYVEAAVRAATDTAEKFLKVANPAAIGGSLDPLSLVQTVAGRASFKTDHNLERSKSLHFCRFAISSAARSSLLALNGSLSTCPADRSAFRPPRILTGMSLETCRETLAEAFQVVSAQSVNVRKDPYYADVGDFSSAGSVTIDYLNKSSNRTDPTSY
jgi:hypothetical protein